MSKYVFIHSFIHSTAFIVGPPYASDFARHWESVVIKVDTVCLHGSDGPVGKTDISYTVTQISVKL